MSTAADHCGDGTTELTPCNYSQAYVPGGWYTPEVTYVFESYYPSQCADTYPTAPRCGRDAPAAHAVPQRPARVRRGRDCRTPPPGPSPPPRR